MDKFCTKCGAQISETDLVCPNCGEKIKKTESSAPNMPEQKESKAWIFVLIGAGALFIALIVLLVMLAANVVRIVIENNSFNDYITPEPDTIVQVDPFGDDAPSMGGGSSSAEDAVEYPIYEKNDDAPPIEELEGNFIFSISYDDVWADGENTYEMFGFDCYIEQYDDDEVMMELIPMYGELMSYEDEDDYYEYTQEELSKFEQGIVAKYDNGILYFTLDMYQEIDVEMEIVYTDEGTIDGWYDADITDTGNDNIESSYCYIYLFQ